MTNYDATTLQHGNRVRDELKQTPATFGTDSGVAKFISEKGQRMAGGPIGQRALQLMTDPAAAQATANWMKLFGQSNEGLQFNQAKMMMGGGK